MLFENLLTHQNQSQRPVITKHDKSFKMNIFGGDGEAAPSIKRNPERKPKQGHDDGAEMVLEEPRKSRGKRNHEQEQENLLQEIGCSKDHPGYPVSPLVVTSSKRGCKRGVGDLRSSSRVGCVGYNGHDISRNSNVLSRLFSWLRKRRKSKQGDASELDMMRKADFDKRWSAFSIEDKYYAKSQLSIWFPCIFRHPTLSELEAALALMGNRILDKVSRFQIIDLNPNLTLSRAARNHFRSCHQKCERDEFDGELIGALTCERKSSADSSARTRPFRLSPEHSVGSLKSDKILSQLTLITSKIDGLGTNASKNHFLNAERNWRHCAMAGRVEPPADVSSAQSEGDMSELSATKLEEMYDRKKYHVPDWFYLLVQNGCVIELIPADTDDLEIASGEVKDIVESSRQISLHMVPNCLSSDESGHIFVSIIEQERNCPVPTVPRKVPTLREKCQKDYSQSSLVSVDPTPTCSSPSIDESSNKMEGGSRNDPSFEVLFPQDRVLSFRHNWALVDQSISKQQGLIRQRRKKCHKKLDPLPKTGYIGKSEVNPNNTNVSIFMGSHPFRGTFPDGGKENVNSVNVKKCRQHKQMISRILKLMKERSLADKSSGGGDESHKSVDPPGASDVTADKASIIDTHDCRRRQKSKLTRCRKNVRFADTIKQRDKMISPGNRARTEVNKSNSAIDDIDKLGETSSSPFGKAETILDQNYSSLHGEYFAPERYRRYDVDYLTKSIEINNVSEMDQNHDVCNSSIFWADPDLTNLRRLRKPDVCDLSHLAVRADDSANFILGEELARLVNTQCKRKTHKRGDTKTYKLYNMDRLGEMDTNDEHNETGADLTGIPKAVHVSSSNSGSTSVGYNVGVKQCRHCGKQAFTDYARGTLAKFVKEQWHLGGKCEPLHAPKVGSGHKLQTTISSNQATNAKAGKYPPELSRLSREKRRSCSKARPDTHKTKQTEGTMELVELRQNDYEIACANRRLGYNYICTIVDEYYKSFASGDDETAGVAQRSHSDSETPRHVDAKSQHVGKCSSYKTGGVRDMVVKSTATPDDNKSVALLIDRYLAADDENVVDITKPLKDLDSLLEYCSRMTSADCLLGDSTLNILRAINDIITRFITLEDEKLASRVKDDFAGGIATAEKNQKSCTLQQSRRPHNVPCRKVIDVATQTYSKSINDCEKAAFVCCRCRPPKDSMEHSIEAEHYREHAVDPFQSCETRESTRSDFHHLDETQNKLDSETDYPSAGKILTSDEPAGESGTVSAPESGHSTTYARPLSGELERLLAHARRQSSEGADEYSDTLLYPSQKSAVLKSRNSPERLEPAFFSSQRLTSVENRVGGSGASPAQDRGAFARPRRDPKPLEIVITPASPPNLSDNHGSLASNENGTAFPKQTEDVLSRYYAGLINGTDKLRTPSVFPETSQEHAFRYGEQRRSYYDGAINQNLRPEKSVRMKDENYILPDRESTGIETSKIFHTESAFNPNRRLPSEVSPKQTQSFAVQTDPNVSCNRTNCHLQVCTGDCLTQACPARCASHPYTSSCSPCASALPRNLVCHCKPEVTMRSCMTPPPWRPRYRLCKNAYDDNLVSYLCQRNRISDFPSSFLNFRPSLNVTPNARFCRRTLNDIFCDLKRENTSPDCFSEYRRKPAQECANFFERKPADKFPTCSMRNSRCLNFPTFESAPETQRRFPPQRSEPPMQVSDPNSASDIQQQTLALIGQVLNTLQTNRKPPDVVMTDKPNTSPSSDGGSCSKPCKERRRAAEPRKKCKRVKSECPCKNCEKDPPSDQSLQRVQVDAKSRNLEVDFIEEISEQSLPRTRMCTKSLQVNVETCARQPAPASPAPRASARNVGMASVQTCACISKPSGECQCGCLSEKLTIPQRKCLCADQLVIEIPAETSGCPCTVKKNTCVVNRCLNQESPPCCQNKCFIECNKNKSVQTSVVCPKVSCNKKCQIGKLNPVACVSTDVCGSTRFSEPSLNECGKAPSKLKWDQPPKQSRSSEMCGDSDVSDCTSTVHRFPTGQRLTGQGSCQRKSPRINFQVPSQNYCDRVRPCLQNLCGNIPMRSREHSVIMSPCFPICCGGRKTYQQKYGGSVNSCRQRRSDMVTRSFQSLLDNNSMPVKAASSVINRDSRAEELYNLPECGRVQEKSSRLRSCITCGTRRDTTSPRKFSFTPADASNARKTAWCECDAPKEDASAKTGETDSKVGGADVPSLKQVEKDAEKCRPFVQIKYKSKRVISDKEGDARQVQPCSANGVKGLAEQLKEQIDEIISRSRDLQQQAIQFNVGSARCYVDTGVDNRLTGCDNRLTSCDNRPAGCDNRLTSCDNSLTGCDYRLTGCDNRLTGCDYRLTGYDNRATASDNRGTASDNRGTASDNRGMGSNNRGMGSDNRGMGSDNRGMGSDNRGTASDNRGMGSDNRGMGSDNRGTASDNRGMGSDNRGMGSDNRGTGSDYRGTGSDNNFPGFDNNATGSDNRATGLSYDARSKNSHAFSISDARAVNGGAASVTGAGFRISNTPSSPRSEIKIRNSQVASGSHFGVKSSGIHPPQNSVMEVTDPESLRIGQVRPSDLAVLADMKTTSATSAVLVKDGSYRPVEGESTVIDMGTRGSQDVIRFQTEREGNEGWSFYEVEVNDPKSPREIKKTESSPNKNFNSNKTGNKVEIQNVKQFGNCKPKPKLCASDKLNIFSDAFRVDKMSYKFPERTKCVMNKVCPACKKTYTIVPGFRPIVLGHCTNLNVSWNASSGDGAHDRHPTGQVSRGSSRKSVETFSDQQPGPDRADGMSPGLVGARDHDNLNSIRLQTPKREGSRNIYNSGTTMHFTPERAQGGEGRANSQKREDHSALKQKGVPAKLEDVKPECGAGGDGLLSRRLADYPGHMPLNAIGDIVARTTRRGPFQEGCNLADRNGPNLAHRRLKMSPLMRNKNLNSVEYHEISCEERVSSSNDHPNDMNERMANQEKLLHCGVSSMPPKGDQNCGRYSQRSRHYPVNNGSEAIKSDQSKMQYTKHQGMLYKATDDMNSQCQHGIKEHTMQTKRQGMAVPNTEHRQYLANSEQISKSRLRNTYTHKVAAKCGAARRMDSGITTTHEATPQKTTIVEDLSNSSSTPEFSTSYECQRKHHDGGKYKTSHFIPDPSRSRSRIITSPGTGSSFDSKQFQRSYRTHARQHDKILPRCFAADADNAMAETMLTKHGKTSSSSRITNSVLEKEVLLVRQAKPGLKRRTLVAKKVEKFAVEDNGETKSSTRMAPRGEIVSGNTRPSQSADSAASSHGIEDLPTDSWVNVSTGPCQENSIGERSGTVNPSFGAVNSYAMEQKELVQRVWRGNTSGSGSEHSTVISDNRIITARPWREGFSLKKRVRNIGVQIDEQCNDPSVDLPVTRNSSSVVSQNYTITPRRRSAQHNSDQTDLDVSTSGQFNGTLTSGECTTQFSRPWFPKDELVKWWNSTKGQHEGDRDTKVLHLVPSDSRCDVNSYHDQSTKQRIMTDPRIVASILGPNVIRRSRPSWVECKDSATLTDDIMYYLHAQNIQMSTEDHAVSAGVATRLSGASTESARALQRSPETVSSRPGCSIHPPDVSRRGHPGAQLGGGSWRNVFVSCGDLTEASDERVLLEGAFCTPWCADRGEPCDSVSRTARSAPGSLPFRLVLFSRADGKMGTKVYGTFLRRLSQSDRSFKWKVKINLPCKSDSGILISRVIRNRDL